MASVGTLSLNVKANVGRAVSGLSRVRKSVSGLTRLIPGLGAAFSAVSLGGIAIFVKRELDAIDATAKLADRIGTTTEAITGLQHAANITGAGADLVTRSMDVLAKRLGEAATGSGEAKSALDQLGLSVGDLLGKDPAEQIRLIADQFQMLATQEEKAAVASDLFSRAGLKMVNLLDQGRKGIVALEKDAKKLGLTFSRTDAAMVEAANDARTRLGAALTGVARTLTIELAPVMKVIADRFTNWATEGEGLRAKVVPAIRDMVLALNELRTISLHAALAQLQLANAAAWVTVGVPRALGAFQREFKILEGMIDTLKSDIENDPKAIVQFFEEIGKAAERNAKIAQSSVHKIGRAAVKTQGFPSSFSSSSRDVGMVGRGRRAGEAPQAIGEAAEDAGDPIRVLGLETNRLADAANGMGHAFATAFDRAIKGATEFDQVVLGLGQDIASSLLRSFVTAPISAAVSSLFTPTDIFAEGSSWFSGAADAPAPAELINVGLVTSNQVQGNINALGGQVTSLGQYRG